MRLIVQSPARIGRVLKAIVENVYPDTEALYYAVAYVTFRGARLLVDRLQHASPIQWSDQEKCLITCFDYGHTDPSALEFLRDSGFRIFIANLDADGQVRISPASSAFHPKLYISQRPSGIAAIVSGSANLSYRALISNFEVVSLSIEPYYKWFPTWHNLCTSASPLSQSILEEYIEARQSIPSVQPNQSAVPDLFPSHTDVGTLEQAVVERGVDPASFSGFWIEVGFASGGSQNQIELPRLASQFFGHPFDDYHLAQATIAFLTIRTSQHEVERRKLTWHGNNRMERILVPTVIQGGERVANRVVFFERTAGSFLMTVADVSSFEHRQWREASMLSGTQFRLGSAASSRTCGLI